MPIYDDDSLFDKSMCLGCRLYEFRCVLEDHRIALHEELNSPKGRYVEDTDLLKIRIDDVCRFEQWFDDRLRCFYDGEQ